jgi:hypothetical protein
MLLVQLCIFCNDIYIINAITYNNVPLFYTDDHRQIPNIYSIMSYYIDPCLIDRL